MFLPVAHTKWVAFLILFSLFLAVSTRAIPGNTARAAEYVNENETPFDGN